MTFADDFDELDGRCWLNCAHQGPLPRVATEAALEALRWKQAPHRLDDAAFHQVPARLKQVLGRLLGVPANQVILGNSTSYGLHLLANGIVWRPGDEVLLIEGDFPASLLPWTGLDAKGVRLRTIPSTSAPPSPAEVADRLSTATRVFCASWVNSFTGHALDLQGIGRVCRQHGVRFVVNASQGIGALPFDASRVAVDAVTTCGFKWLCGPYATGCCWIEPGLLDRLRYNQNYWLTAQAGQPLESMREVPLEPVTGVGAARYDVFCPANFLSFAPWAAAVGYLLERGIDRIAEHDQRLVDQLVAGLLAAGFELTSPLEGPARSAIVVASAADPARNAGLHRRLRERGIDIALREGKLRFSPHLYNTDDDISRTLDALSQP